MESLIAQSLAQPLTKAEAERRLEDAARAGKRVDWRCYRAMGLDVQAVQAVQARLEAR